jgi:fatty acid kinase fatty acid binding subunit
MTIQIVTDSTCDLPQQTVEALGITVIPMLVQIGSQVYLDGIDITRKQFYEQLSCGETYVHSLVPDEQVFCQTYERLVAQGATEILSIHLMESLSTVAATARAAAAQIRGAQITVLDARQVSLGVGFQVDLAARTAAAGKSVDEILVLLNNQIRRTHVVAMLDMLEYLRRGGRLGDAVAGLAGLLKFKPLIKIYDGKPSAEGVRTRERASDRLVQILTEIGPLERLALLHSNAPDRAEDLRRKAVALLPPGEIDIVDITPTIGAHTGPDMVGFACVAA